jgi:hypothetical protein
MRLSAEIDRPLDEFDWYSRAIEVNQGALDRLVRVIEEHQDVRIGKILLKFRTNHAVHGAADESCKIVVDSNNGGAFANQEPLESGVGGAAH